MDLDDANKFPREERPSKRSLCQKIVDYVERDRIEWQRKEDAGEDPDPNAPGGPTSNAW